MALIRGPRSLEFVLDRCRAIDRATDLLCCVPVARLIDRRPNGVIPFSISGSKRPVTKALCRWVQLITRRSETARRVTTGICVEMWDAFQTSRLRQYSPRTEKEFPSGFMRPLVHPVSNGFMRSVEKGYGIDALQLRTFSISFGALS
jgi:hypothetical protein